ncbi:MAG: hypothetical protein HYR85_23100 [Planctomycetes bacterium]|nr:hypothetical protein [Planctomycetota bacterium]
MAAGTETVQMALEQSGAHVTGSLTTFQTFGNFRFAYHLDGTLDGQRLTFTLNETFPSPPGFFEGTGEIDESGNQLTFSVSGTTISGMATKEPRGLEVVSFDQAARSDVARNEPLTVTFDGAIDPRSVSSDAFVVRFGFDVFPGRVVVDGNTLTFHPTVLPGDRNDYEPATAPLINGLGFLAFGRYRLDILAGTPISIRATDGRSLRATFSASFATNDRFVPESPQARPRVVGLPTFSPGLILDGDVFGDPNSPSTLPLFDPTSVRISVTFSEPMLPGLFDPLRTFTVVNITPANPTVGCEVAGLGRPIPGNIERSADGLTFTFVPLVTLGDRPCTGEPFVFEVTLSAVLTDLAGITLAEPYVFHFATADKPTEPTFAVITEDFTTSTHQGSATDSSHPNTASWGGGRLTGPPVTRRTVDTSTRNPERPMNEPRPLTPDGSRVQVLYFPPDFTHDDGTAAGMESIVSMAWGPRFNSLFAATYPDMTMKLGISRSTVSQGLQATFDVNYSGFSDNPTVVFRGSYTVPTAENVAFWPWPDFQTDFEYAGTRSVVFEIDNAPGGDTEQLFRVTGSAPSPQRMLLGPYDSLTGDPLSCRDRHCVNGTFHQQFVLATKRSFGVSTYYDLGAEAIEFAAPLVVFDEARGRPCRLGQKSGCFAITWEGADATAMGIPDPNTATGFSPDVNIAIGHRFIRFEIRIDADPFTGIVPPDSLRELRISNDRRLMGSAARERHSASSHEERARITRDAQRERRLRRCTRARRGRGARLTDDSPRAAGERLRDSADRRRLASRSKSKIRYDHVEPEGAPVGFFFRSDSSGRVDGRTRSRVVRSRRNDRWQLAIVLASRPCGTPCARRRL